MPPIGFGYGHDADRTARALAPRSAASGATVAGAARSRRVGGGFRVPAPDLRLDVVREEHRRTWQRVRHVDERHQEIAHDQRRTAVLASRLDRRRRYAAERYFAMA